MNNRISIHIASKDRASELAILLNCLRYQTYQDFDIMILDNAYGTPLSSSFPFLHAVIGRLKIEGCRLPVKRRQFFQYQCTPTISL